MSGSGTAGDPYLVSHTETEFTAVEGDGIEVTPGGTDGHSPEIAVKLDPDSTADVSVGPDGLLVNLPTDDTIPTLAFLPGMEMGWAGDTAPSGFFLEDGSLKEIALYPLTFAVCGHRFNGGVDPGGGMFRIPDCRKRPTYGPGAADTIGDQDGTPGSESTLGKTHVHTGPSHTHPYTPSGSLSSEALTTGDANGTDPANYHAGYILNESGHDKLVADSDLTLINGDFAPGADNNPDNFTKKQHDHDIAAHDHDFTGTADDTDPAGTGNTGSAAVPYQIKWTIIKHD